MATEELVLEKSTTSDKSVTQGKQCVLGKFITEADGWKIVEAAKSWEGTPYSLVGANSVRQVGGDCSGTTKKSFTAAGFPYSYQSTASFAGYAAKSLRFRKIDPAKQSCKLAMFCYGRVIWQFMQLFQKVIHAGTLESSCAARKWQTICTLFSIAAPIHLTALTTFRHFGATRILCIAI